MASTWQHLNEDEKAGLALADDARDANAVAIAARAWQDIDAGTVRNGRTEASRHVDGVFDLLAADTSVLERLIVNAAGMHKQDQLRGWYAEAVARDVEALVKKAIEAHAFAAALEAAA